MCDRWKVYFDGLANVREERSDRITVRFGMRLGVFEKAGASQEIRSNNFENVKV